MFGSAGGVGVILWLVWTCVILASVVVTIRAMLALVQIPARLDAIERAIRDASALRDDRLP